MRHLHPDPVPHVQRMHKMESRALSEEPEAGWVPDYSAEPSIAKVATQAYMATGFSMVGALVVVCFGLWLASGELQAAPLIGIAAIALVSASGIWRAQRKLKDAWASYWSGGPTDSVREWDVLFDIVQGQVVTGRDSGRLWIQDRSIYVVGRRTSFVLSRWQLESGFAVRFNTNPFRPFERSVEVKLAKLGSVEDWSLQLDPSDTKFSPALASSLKEVARDPDPFQLGQFPPRALGPDPSTRSKLWLALAKAPFVLSTPGWICAGYLAIALVIRSTGQWLPSEAFLLGRIALALMAFGWLASVWAKVRLAVRALRNYNRVVEGKGNG